MLAEKQLVCSHQMHILYSPFDAYIFQIPNMKMRSLRTLQCDIPEMFLRALVGKVWCKAAWLCAGFKHSCYASDADAVFYDVEK